MLLGLQELHKALEARESKILESLSQWQQFGLCIDNLVQGIWNEELVLSNHLKSLDHEQDKFGKLWFSSRMCRMPPNLEKTTSSNFYFNNLALFCSSSLVNSARQGAKCKKILGDTFFTSASAETNRFARTSESHVSLHESTELQSPVPGP